jgi:hypothetical protein
MLTIDDQCLPRHHVGIRRGEEHGRAGEILGLERAPESAVCCTSAPRICSGTTRLSHP